MLIRRDETPDLILYNGTVHSVNKNDDIFQAVAVTGGVITAVGDDEDICALAAENTRMIDLKGRSLPRDQRRP